MKKLRGMCSKGSEEAGDLEIGTPGTPGGNGMKGAETDDNDAVQVSLT